MGTRIESVATACKRGRLHHRGALYLTDSAATTCLQRAGRSAHELDLLINTGVYKDGNAAEPALASIIQEDIDANPEVTLHHGHGTFAFDVLNGGCGVLTAARLADTFVGHGTARSALIVAADVDPSPRTTHHFPFAPVGGAMLVSHVAERAGFRAFEFHTFPRDADLFEVNLRWDPDAGLLHRGRNVIDVHASPELAARSLELAADVASAFLVRQGLAPAEIDLLITSQYPRSVALELGLQLGIPATRVPHVRRELARAHTAGPIAALEAASGSGQLASARRILFVTVGAGITVGVALYESH